MQNTLVPRFVYVQFIKVNYIDASSVGHQTKTSIILLFPVNGIVLPSHFRQKNA